MKTATKQKPVVGFNKEFVLGSLEKIWDHWVDGLGYTEASAGKKMNSVITHLHKAQTKKKASKTAKKVSKAAPKKKTSAKPAKKAARSKKSK